MTKLYEVNCNEDVRVPGIGAGTVRTFRHAEYELEMEAILAPAPDGKNAYVPVVKVCKRNFSDKKNPLWPAAHIPLVKVASWQVWTAEHDKPKDTSGTSTVAVVPGPGRGSGGHSPGVTGKIDPADLVRPATAAK